ncbi:MAG: DedA family protein [Longimonas sp.]|uniref:DedA family protein n=1 Tax=Longimonas sp. TaxID=2039626 RepID=UPI0039765F44
MPEWVFELDAWVNWMLALPPLWGYVIVLTIAYGENVMPPIPGDMIVVLGGYLAGRGHLHFGAVVVLATIGGALGFMTMYALGRVFGARILEPGRYRWIPHSGVERAQRWLHRYGYGVVAANRFLSGARSVISLAVGAAGMSAWKTLFFATLSALVWTSLISYAGYALGDNWPVVASYLDTYGRIVGSILLLLLIVWIGRWYWRRQRPASDTKSPS